MDRVPRMLRSVLCAALLIRGPWLHNVSVGPGSAEQREVRRTASGTRDLLPLPLAGEGRGGALAASEFVETSPTRLRCAKAPSPASGRGKNITPTRS